MRYQPLPPEVHIDARRALAKAIGPDAIAIIDTADVLMRSADSAYPFRPDSNFYYLAGIDEPEAVLVLIPGHPNAQMREILFVSGTNEFVGTWEGERLTPEAASQLSGVKSVLEKADFKSILDRLLQRYHTVYLGADESLLSRQSSPAKRRAKRLRLAMPLHQFRSVLPLLASQRMVKHPAEVEQIRRAIAVTGAGLKQAWAAMRPGRHEYELEAELIAEYLRQGSHGHGFPPIVASGAGATIIHYMKNDQPVGEHDLVLFDTGAEVGWYAADISRTVPASGRFTERQRAVYEAVLRAQRAGIEQHKPSATIFSADERMREVLTAEIKKLGLKSPLHDYYPHISHHLGLDVHDLGDPRAKFEPGMVVTCEPGLYLRDEGIGVRLEDDILITKDGCEVLSRDIPSDPDELEALLAR